MPVVFNLPERRSQSSCVGGRAAVPVPAEQAPTGFWTEALGWAEKTREDDQFRMRNLGRHVTGMGSPRAGGIEFFFLQTYISELGYTGSLRISRDWSRRGWGLYVT